jgi:predicted MFS family arabinose efflux permease
MAAVVETVLPARLGRGFRWLLASALATNLGDGIALAAGPLLVASLTRDPLVVSFAVFATWLPPLVVGLFAGAVADRLDRRRIVIVVNLARAVVFALLAVSIAGGSVSIGVVLAALLALGTAETFADVGSSSLLPRLVPRADLGLANARLQAAHLSLNSLVAPPIGAFLFAAGMAIPFAIDAVCFAFGAVLIARMVVPPSPEPPREPTTIRADLAQGVRWLLHHPPMRTLALTIVAFNVTFGAAWSVLVLYADERLGMSAVGFGLITTATGIGGLAGSMAYGRLERRFRLGDIMRVGLLIETVTHLVLALTDSPAVALAMLVVFGAHATIWGTTAATVRQRAVPDALMGRVTGVYTVGLMAGLVAGAPIGGLLARSFGITGPFWFGFVGSALLVLVLWRQFAKIVHASEHPDHVPAGPTGS